jgi:hypothetical protein
VYPDHGDAPCARGVLREMASVGMTTPRADAGTDVVLFPARGVGRVTVTVWGGHAAATTAVGEVGAAEAAAAGPVVMPGTAAAPSLLALRRASLAASLARAAAIDTPAARGVKSVGGPGLRAGSAAWGPPYILWVVLL